MHSSLSNGTHLSVVRFISNYTEQNRKQYYKLVFTRYSCTASLFILTEIRRLLVTFIEPFEYTSSELKAFLVSR
jgi:hypothetical protein